MTEPERIKWESSMGFVSQRTLYNNLLSELDAVTTESELKDILNKNKDIITINPDFEINPALEYGQYSLFTNRQGYFSINGILHKVTQKNTYISKKQGITDLDQILLEEGINSDKLLVLENSSNVITKNCGNYLEGQVTEGNRRAKIYMQTYRSIVYDGYYFYVHDYVDWWVKGYKKIFFAWYSYNTIYDYRDVSFTVRTMVHSLYGKGAKAGVLPEYTERSASFPGPETSPYEDWIYTWTGPIGETFEFTDEIPSEVVNEANLPTFIQVEGEGRSRGTVGWAKISCGY